MDDEGNDGGNSGGQTWELAKLIGRYETSSEMISNRLARIEERLEEGSASFSDIKTTMATRTEQVQNLETRLAVVEKNDGELSKRRRLQVDGTTLAAIILALKEIVTAIIGALH